MADREVLRGYHSLMSTARAFEAPEDPPYDYETAVSRILSPPPDERDSFHWLAYRDSGIVGFSRATLGVRENSRLAKIEVWIHPDTRRQGIGTALVRAMLPILKEGGYTTIMGLPVKLDSAGEAWTRVLGFHVTYKVAIQALQVTPAVRALWDVAIAPGYELVHWTGAAPERLLEPYAAARPAIADAPRGQSTYHDTAWTAERVRESERELIEQGVEERVVVAVDSETGEVAGLTILRFFPGLPNRAYQEDTVVTAPHRGQGLGRAMKAAMMRWTLAEHPDLQRVVTSTSAENRYMMQVNCAIGYKTVRVMKRTEIALDELASHPMVAGSNPAGGTR